MTPTLVYLHGIGAEHDDAWREVVSVALVEAGYPGLFDGVDCRAPKYPNTLRYPSDERHALPPQTSPRLSRSERDDLRWRVERATADLERALGVHAAGWGLPLAAETVPAVMKVIPQARRYLDDEATRANTLHRVLAALPESGPIVVLAHSLGTVIAADLLTRLPAEIEVVGVITVGSPAGLLGVHRGSDRLEVLREPLPQGWLVAQRVGRRRPGDGPAWALPPVPVGARHRAARCAASDGALPGLGHRRVRRGAGTVRKSGPRAVGLPVPSRARDRRRRAERVPAADLRPLRGRAPAERPASTLPRRSRDRPFRPHHTARADRYRRAARPGPVADAVEVDRADAAPRCRDDQPGRALRHRDRRIRPPRRAARRRRVDRALQRVRPHSAARTHRGLR